MRTTEAYVRSRSRSLSLVKLVPPRPCKFPDCKRMIRYVPGDMDIRYVRFCMYCREKAIPNEGSDNWLGHGLVNRRA
jgi:hypothetical protein